MQIAETRARGKLHIIKRLAKHVSIAEETKQSDEDENAGQVSGADSGSKERRRPWPEPPTTGRAVVPMPGDTLKLAV